MLFGCVFGSDVVVLFGSDDLVVCCLAVMIWLCGCVLCSTRYRPSLRGTSPTPVSTAQDQRGGVGIFKTDIIMLSLNVELLRVSISNSANAFSMKCCRVYFPRVAVLK